MSIRFRAPSANGEILAVPGFPAIPAIVQHNRHILNDNRVSLAGESLASVRESLRRELFPTHDPAAPVLVTGHQPELSHPGVWVKNFALCGLARILGALSVNVIVDNDTLKTQALRFPVFRARDAASVRLESLAFDTFAGEVPYEDAGVRDAELFRTFASRAAPLWENWGYEPLVAKYWQAGANIGETFATMRVTCERAWGCENRELPVSRLAQTSAFALFAQHILRELPRFREVYNAAILAYRDANGIRSANHPAPLLRDGEAPFWVRTATGRRERATPDSDMRLLRPRALTLTLFARLCLGDYFIHGIGGGKYDEVTDAIIRDFFDVEPPAYQVLSATLHLPLAGFASTPEDLSRAEHRVRDLHWNPQAYILNDTMEMAIVRRKRVLIDSEPAHGDHAARREWFRSLSRVTEQLRRYVVDRANEANEHLQRIKSEVAANAILQRRNFAWVWYPEETLRPFLQRFLAL
jgi:hypothetical protein